MILDWLVLIVAFVAMALRLAVGTDLDALRADADSDLRAICRAVRIMLSDQAPLLSSADAMTISRHP
jgi:hypothetical protein